MLAIAASILVARHLRDLDARQSPALEPLMANAVRVVERIMRKIDSQFPSSVENSKKVVDSIRVGE